MPNYSSTESENNTGNKRKNFHTSDEASKKRVRKSLIPLPTSNNSPKSSEQECQVFNGYCKESNKERVSPGVVHTGKEIKREINNNPVSMVTSLPPRELSPNFPDLHPISMTKKVNCVCHPTRSIHSVSVQLADHKLVGHNQSAERLCQAKSHSHNNRVGMIGQSESSLESGNTSGHKKSTSNLGIDKVPKVESSISLSDLNCSLLKFAHQFAETASRSRGYFLCPICSEPFSQPVVIACGHLFCMRCASGWFEEQENCPCCRYRIVVKELISGNNFVAKGCPEVSYILPSIFKIGNLHTSLKDEGISYDLGGFSLENSTISLSDISSEEFLSSVVAPIFREIFCHGAQKSQIETTRNSFIGALWLLKHSLSLSDAVEGEDVTFLQCLPGLIRHESLYGSDVSRESLIIHVMTMKSHSDRANRNSSFTIPFTPINSKEKIPNNSVQGHQQQRAFRFRLPSANGLTKLILASCIFIFIAFAVHIFDEKNYSGSPNVQFSKVDFFVYFVTVFTLISYTETERLIHGRRRQRRSNNNIRRNFGTWSVRYLQRSRRRRNVRQSQNVIRDLLAQ